MENDQQKNAKEITFDQPDFVIKDLSNTAVVEGRYKQIDRILDSGMLHKDSNMVIAGVGKTILELTATIRDFNLTTTNLTKKANSLIRWYVILTAVIAVATVASLWLR